MSYFSASISRRNRKWCLHLVEEDEDLLNNFFLFDRIITWVDDTLLYRKDVSRMSYDMWYFDNKTDAEKFLVILTLKWL